MASENRGYDSFSTVVLADEINRASPKTQSALLEVMEEGHVTVDGVEHGVGKPFMVVATQNPIEQAGTYRIPEAQLDRFLMKASLGYPDHESTVSLLADAANRDRTAAVSPLITSKAASEMAALADLVHVDQAVLAYVSRIAEESRRAKHVRLGLSVRGCSVLRGVAQNLGRIRRAALRRSDDIKELAIPIMSHRLLLDAEAEFNGVDIENVIARILSEVQPPVGPGGGVASCVLALNCACPSTVNWG